MGAPSRELQDDQHTKNPRRRRRCSPPCELCLQPACLYCPCDEAMLCDLCDAKVHSANFLVARHSRYVLCPCCGEPDRHSPHTGPRIEPRRRLQPCSQCRLHMDACQQLQQLDADALSSAESCCIDAEEDGDSSAFSLPSPPERRLSSCCTHSSQEEGLGDSEDGSYGALQSSPPRRRRRVLR